ncbi:MAG TPA: VWA domain-containing protein [Candidatus Sulfotelmatobacter sp.]|jgi:VWFA-related protein
MEASLSLPTRVFLAAILCAGTASAQNDSSLPEPANPDSQKVEASGLVFHQNVRRVVVDVVVSDANGKSVSGLAANDFSISEDGKPQRIRSFDVHDFDAISDSLPKPPPSLPANTFVNVPSGPERGPLYVLLLDLLNIAVDDQPRAREQLLKFVRSKPLGTRFAIFVLSDGLYLVQGFTEDRNLLADALDYKRPRSHIPRIFIYADNYQAYFSTARALVRIAKFLAELPGHKNVIWLSSSFPTSMMPNSDPGTEALNSDEEIKEATDTLARGQIAVYPVDVRGAVVTHVMSRPQGGAMVTTSDSAALNASYMTEEEIAHSTGGRAFYGTNDLATALTEATETGSRYYTLTYSPSNQNYNGRQRHINVELSKHGYHLAYRRSYYGDPSSTGAKETHSASELEPMLVSRAADSLSPNMQHGAPLAHALLFRAHIHALGPPAKATPAQMASLADQPAYFRERRKNHSAEPLKPIPLQTYKIDYAIAARYPALEIAAAAFDGDGMMVNATVQRVSEDSTQVSAGERHDRIYRVQQQFDVPMGAVSIRVAVRDVATDNVGALEINLPLAAEAQTHAAVIPTDPASAPDIPNPR